MHGSYHILMGAFVICLGLATGSFLNVMIWRLPRGGSISHPRTSRCPHCDAPLRAADNIPLLSFLILRGRCRYCGGPISWRYPLVEATTALLMLAVYLTQGVYAGTGPGQLIVMGLVVALLIGASGIDMEFRIIPDEISLYGVLGGLAASALLPELHVGPSAYHTVGSLTGISAIDGLIGGLMGTFIGGSIVLLFAVVGALVFGQEALGIGDVKLMAMVGAFLGWKVALLAFFLAPFFGLFYGLPLLLFTDEHKMPYGPFLSGGALLTILFRDTACLYLQRYIEIIRAITGL